MYVLVREPCKKMSSHLLVKLNTYPTAQKFHPR